MKYFISFILVVMSMFCFAYDSYDSESVTTDSTFYQLAKTVYMEDVERMSLIVYNEGDGDCDATYQIRLYPDKTTKDYIYYGTATSASSTALIDSNATFAVNLNGQTIYNVTDGSEGTITDTTSTYIYTTLSGGTDNDWDAGDFYRVSRPQQYYSIGGTSLASGEQAVYELENYYTRADLFIKKTAAGDSTATLKYSYNFKTGK
jgi:hypothetical protein